MFNTEDHQKILGKGTNEAPHLADLKRDEKISFGVRFADAVAAFSGSIVFLGLNFAWFVVWIVLNTLFGLHFDPYPFQFLTMSVSLEAIFLSIFVLISQNRQAAKDRLMIENDYETNRRAEQENRLLLTYIEQLDSKVNRLLAGDLDE